jgi:hypothetical protein
MKVKIERARFIETFSSSVCGQLAMVRVVLEFYTSLGIFIKSQDASYG